MLKKSEIRSLIVSRGLRLSKRLGQNFLIDANLLRAMVKTADLGPEDLVLEIGAGPGTLTGALCDRAGRVIAVEIDRGLLAIARERLEKRSNLILLPGDVLAGKSGLNPDLESRVRETMDRAEIASLKVVSNLPYSVATPVILNLLESGLPIDAMLLTVQLEVAERLTAKEISKEYGLPSLLVHVRARAEILRRIPPQCFWPAPRVESALIRILPRRGEPVSVDRYALLKEVGGAIFRHRRKTIFGALRVEGISGLGESEILPALRAVGLDRTARCEGLCPERITALADAIRTIRRARP
jgi:16S rRNA (adenine1518-N6/adenine1519-N6)-dimethyltransferase